MKKPVVSLAVVVGFLLAVGPGVGVRAAERPEAANTIDELDLRNAYVEEKPESRPHIELPRPIEFQPIPHDPAGGRPGISDGLSGSVLAGFGSSALGKATPGIETERDVRRVIRSLD